MSVENALSPAASVPPTDYPRRILLLIGGMSPQIVTETLYALCVQSQPAYRPTEIHLVTTARGERSARLNLLSPAEGHFHAFCREWGADPATFRPKNIHVITDASGNPLDDILTLADNEAAADLITRLIRHLAADPLAALHVSLAGGRKTMGYYAGHAMSLFGRQQDRLSHVLVSEGFDGHRDFYYPTRESRPVRLANGDVLDAREARIWLVDMPFFRLRGALPKVLLDKELSFSEIIALAQEGSRAPTLLVDQAPIRIIAAGLEIPFKPMHLAFFLWVAGREHAGLPQPNVTALREGSESYARQFMACYERVCGPDRDLEKTRHGLRLGMDQNFFNEKRSRANETLINRLGPDASTPYLIQREGPKGYSRYRLPLGRNQIQWRIDDINPLRDWQD